MRPYNKGRKRVANGFDDELKLIENNMDRWSLNRNTNGELDKTYTAFFGQNSCPDLSEGEDKLHI